MEKIKLKEKAGDKKKGLLGAQLAIVASSLSREEDFLQGLV
jgi:hypothetical protein